MHVVCKNIHRVPIFEGDLPDSILNTKHAVRCFTHWTFKQMFFMSIKSQ